MSIIAARVRSRKKPPSLGDAIDDLNLQWARWFGMTGPSPTNECLASANASTAALDQKISDLNKNWNPTGFYSPTQITGLVTNIQGMLRQASSTIDQQLEEPTAEGDRQALALSKADIARKMNESLVFVRAAHEASTRGITAIDSPGFKRFIVNAMLVGSSAITGAAFVSCMRPWFVSALSVFQIYFDTVWTLARAVVGIAVALGQQVLEIPDTLSTLWRYAKWTALIVGGYYAYTEGPRLYKEITR